ncbi:hypothetical protein SDC9_97092 [bioreactor metagenome]|uniref:Uncharacterized protein n=1 Tax=bioreactor metagenome TaxID=1076179 RepID=A0A645AHL0_9ZZZZ
MYGTSEILKHRLLIRQGGKQQDQKAHIIGQRCTADLTMPLAKLCAQPAVNSLVDLALLIGQLLYIGHYITKHGLPPLYNP